MPIEAFHPSRNEPPRVMQKFIGANIFYLLIVHVWAFGIPALGRDLQRQKADVLEPVSRQLAALQMSLFGDAAFLYQSLNILLLWGCMICIFFLTRFAVRGPWWLGSLSATLFMANPLKTEAMLYHTGFADLLPALAALLSITLYAWHAAKPRRLRYASAVLFFAAACLFERNLPLVLVFLLYERLLVPAAARRYVRLIPLAMLAAVAFFPHVDPTRIAGFATDPIGTFLPLYLTLYPIGLLPETAHYVMGWPILFWTAVVVVLVLLWFVYCKTQHPALAFAIAGMVASRLFQAPGIVDPVHLAGGGTMLLPLAFFYLALTTVLRQMIQHPKWARPMVTVTTLAAVFFMALQVGVIFQWREGASIADAFRTSARAWNKEHPESEAVLAPAYLYQGFAPLNFDLVFEEELGAVRLAWRVPLHQVPGMEATVREAGKDLLVEVRRAAPYAAVGWPYTLNEVGEMQVAGDCRMTLVSRDEESFVLRVAPADPAAQGILFVPALNDPPPGG